MLRPAEGVYRRVVCVMLDCPLELSAVQQFPDSREVVVVVLGHEAEVVDKTHRLAEAWVQDGAAH